LRVGERVEQVSTIDRVEEKRGRVGSLVFVTVRHAVSGASGVALEEEQDIVYTDPPKGGEPTLPTQPAPRGAWHREITPEETLLFRYSALTFNGHRIHYDRRFAASEGYPGLVVHGPLIATLLLDLVRRNWPALTLERFVFRALRPTFDTSPFTVNGAPEQANHVRLWSTDNQGQIGVEAEAWMG
jgi:3-methylfumaryl-CoA hydratase